MAKSKKITELEARIARLEDRLARQAPIIEAIDVIAAAISERLEPPDVHIETW